MNRYTASTTARSEGRFMIFFLDYKKNEWVDLTMAGCFHTLRQHNGVPNTL